MCVRTLVLIALICFGFTCGEDAENPNGILLINNQSSSNVFVFDNIYAPGNDSIRCGLFESSLRFEELFILSGEESLLVTTFDNMLRDDPSLEVRVYAYKVNMISDVPLCPQAIEGLADTVVIRTIEDLTGDVLAPVVIN